LSDGDVTAILRATARGDRDAAEQLLSLVYEDLRRLAASRVARLPPGQNLQPTALVHEAYLRVMGGVAPTFENRRHFFFVASRAMRDILVEDARRKASLKRGGSQRRVEGSDPRIEAPTADMLDLDCALRKLKRESPERARVVQLRFFTGMSHRETADVLGLSVPTVERRWRYARAWLRRELQRGSPAPA
jgi:RNA polymerase sigma factor (TIGR02999 family)